MSAQLFKLIPEGRKDIDWSAIEAVFPAWKVMSECPQDRFYHAEGDVWTHTKMVCEELVNLAGYTEATSSEKRVLFLTTLLHDVAKPLCTREEDGRISSRGHSRAGAIDARILLWRAGMDFAERESVCRHIIYHQEPFIAVARKANPVFAVHKLSQEVNLKHLALIAEADGRGRRTVPESSWQETLDNVELFRELAKDEGCFEVPKSMADEHTRFMYCRSAGDMSCDYPFYQEPGSQVVMLSGLPASGKDTFVTKNYANLPVISFDDAREELGLKHGQNDGKAVHHATDKAKELLRAKKPFVWNSTHLSAQMRQKTIDLLTAYHARIELVYLEQTESIVKNRNNKRDSTLPNAAIDKMLFKWEVPLPTEAHEVRYLPGLK